MDEQWDGIVARATLNERGTVPRSALATSPDIILAGPVPFQDPGLLLDPGNYGKVYDNGLHVGWPNYLYVRGKNCAPDAQSGWWNLFWARPNILLYPWLWEQNKLATSSGDQNPRFAIGPGAIGATTDPFTWVPSDIAEYYCLIAIAETREHRDPLRGVRDISSLAAALSRNANIAQRNVHSIRGDVPQVAFESGYNQGDEQARVDLSVIFENIPKGSSYTISSGTPLNGQVLGHRDASTIANNFSHAWADLDIPPQWSTRFTCAMTFGGDWSGIPAGQKPTVTIRADLLLGAGEQLYDIGFDLAPDPRTGQPRRGRWGEAVRALTAGSFGIVCPDVGP